MKITTVHTTGGPFILSLWGVMAQVNEVRMLLNIDAGVKMIEKMDFNGGLRASQALCLKSGCNVGGL